MAYITVVRLLVDADSHIEAGDAIYELLMGQMQTVCPESSLIDWHYETFGGPEPVVLPDNFAPNEGPFPEHPRLVAFENRGEA